MKKKNRIKTNKWKWWKNQVHTDALCLFNNSQINLTLGSVAKNSINSEGTSAKSVGHLVPVNKIPPKNFSNRD